MEQSSQNGHPNILEVRNLSVEFKNGDTTRKVLHEVSYELRKGETLGIVGESGSGKSVSTMALMGILPKSARISGSAQMLVDGEVVDLLSLSERQFREIRGRKIATIFQEPMTSLNPVKKCGWQVEEMLKMHENVTPKEAKERTLKLFNEVRLPRPEKIYDSYPHEISGGQKQRVMIAMALICNPDILIADEPTTALDVTVQKTILQLLKEIQDRLQLSIIFITHDLGVIAQIADRVMVMYRGKLVEKGATAQLLCNPQEPYTQGLLACRPPVDSRPRRLPTVSDILSLDQAGAKSPEWKQSDADVLSRKDRHEHIYSQKPLLEVSNLNVEYVLKKNFWGRPKKFLSAVDNVSFEVYKGETLGLVGESGCGKTTLGRSLLHLINSSSGNIVYDGQRIDTMNQHQMRKLRTKLQIVFQDPYSSLNPRLTIGEAIMEPLKVHHILNSESQRREKVLSLMKKVGLEPEWYGRYPHQFSGGQRQRVCIARALIVEPELVVCDESVSALDVSVQAQVLNLLNELKSEFGYTYIFISHDLSVVRFLSDRIMVMEKGRIVEMGDADEIYNNPQKEYTQKLVAAIPLIETSPRIC